jgi:hypothetical protein
MANVQVVTDDQIDWRPVFQMEKDGRILRQYSKTPYVAIGEGLILGRARYDPGMEIEAHFHKCNEIIYIVRGRLTVGGVTYRPGTAIAVEEGTVCGPLVAGPEGAEFLTIRDRPPGGLFRPGETTPQEPERRE